MRPQLIGLIVVSGLLIAADDDAAKKDMAKLQGTWKVKSVQSAGTAVAADRVDKIRFVIQDHKITVKEPDRGDEEATFRIDPSQKPAAITVSPSIGDKDRKGIYQIDGDTLKLSYSRTKDRPKDFEVKADDIVHFVLEREKK